MMDYNEYREKWEGHPREHVTSEFPLHVDCELTSRCNLSCSMCPFHSPAAKSTHKGEGMDFTTYTKIINECAEKGCYSIKLNFGGEPLMYPKLIRAIGYAKKAGIKYIMLNSNGLLLDEINSVGMVSFGLDVFILSDYGHAKQFDNLKILKGARAFFKVPKLVVQSDEPQKWEGIADEVTTPKYYDYINLVGNIEVSDFECPIPFRRLLVLANGDIYKCSCGYYSDGKIIGNVRDTTLEQAWHSAPMNELRLAMEFHRTHEVMACVICPVRREYINDGL